MSIIFFATRGKKKTGQYEFFESFKIVHVNVQSLSNKIDNLQLLFAEEYPLFASVVEHWCTSDKLKSMSVRGYILAASFCRRRYLHGGTAIYTKIGMNGIDMDISKYSIEKIFEVCGVKVILHGIKYGVISAYRVPASDYSLFIDRLGFVLQHCNRLVDILFVCGDLNVNYLLPNNPQKQILDDLLVCFNLKVTSTEPTRIVTSINNLTTISKVDFILTNACSDCYESNVFEGHMGDHRVFTLDYYISMPVKDKEYSGTNLIYSRI